MPDPDYQIGFLEPVPVADPADFRYKLLIRLQPQGGYTLRDGQVHVRQVSVKEANGAPLECSDELEFEQAEYTNTGDDNIVVIVVGEGSALGEMICYEIIVDDVGMLDPRAEVDDQFSMMGNLNRERQALAEAYNHLLSTGLGDSLLGVSLDDFIMDGYDMPAQGVDTSGEKSSD